MSQMQYPAFFDSAPRLVIYDPLSDFLGATERGILEYQYLDVVKVAGHSCPTVAGAYLMTLKALAHLYGEELPVRGEIDVLLPEAVDEGVTGVLASVATLLTGATGAGGFKGIAGRFDRRNGLSFEVDLPCTMAFRRRGTGTVVGAAFNAGTIPIAPAARALMQQAIGGAASSEEEALFRWHWQDRVKRILIDHADDPALVSVHPLS
ncbi:hypothetical protein [Microvirga massiliensis]|uniref:hypothetical protein n=1 Tax=Microvirga massiliensis TaxID=1033741 RepID=UPI00062B3DF8|nr:hypothetical protein [Microvirga massiliensis]